MNCTRKNLEEIPEYSLEVIERSLSEMYSQEFQVKLTNLILASQKDFLNSIRRRIKSNFEFKFKILIEKNNEIVLMINSIEEEIIAIHLKINNLVSNCLIQNKLSEKELFLTEFKKHCNMTGDYAIHQCEGKMIPIFELDELKYVLCEICHKLYTPNSMLLYCYFCSCNYFSTMLSYKRTENLLPATWENLHCGGTQFNEKMRCIKCKDIFYLKIDENMLYCKKCKFIIEPMGIIWKCVYCNQDYKSPAKVYNDIDQKIIKIFIKETLRIKQKAKPLSNPCCSIDLYDLIFYHKKSCDGELFQGELNKQIMILCEKCKMIYHYDKFIWTCPNCTKRFRKSIKSKNLIVPMSVQRSFKKTNSFSEFDDRNTIETEISNKIESNINLDKIILNNYLSTNFLCLYNNKSKSSLYNDELVIDELIDKNDYDNNSYSEASELELKNISNMEFIQKLVTFSPDEYKLLQTIGEGSYGMIYLVEEIYTCNKLAMKKIIINNEKQLITFTNEYEIIHQINHSNILKIKGLSHKKLDETTNVLYILMELAKTDWDREIKLRAMNKNYYTEVELIKIIKQLLDGLSYLQENNIAHRDIKAQNILIFENKLFKLADFGEAKEVKLLYQKHNGTVRGTELYMAPALFNSFEQEKKIEHNPFKSDVFSLGYCILFAATLSFNILYELRKQTDKKMIHAVINKHLTDKYSPKFINLMCRMVEYNEKFRFDFIQLKAFIYTNIS